MASLPILGIGTVTALGSGVDSLREGLAGERVPCIEEERVATPSGEVVLPVYRASCEGLEEFVPRRALRRIDRFSRSALLASHLAFREAGVDPGEMPERIGVVFGSAYGPLETTFQFQDTVIDDGDKCASPTAFANSVHNALASQVSINLGLCGPCTTITTFDETVAGVFDTARLWIERDLVDAVLVGVGENYSPVLGYSLARDSRSWPRAIRPFDFDTCSYLPGEGFAAFLIGKEDQKGRFGRVGAVERLLPNDALPSGETRAFFLGTQGDVASRDSWRRCVDSGVPLVAHAPLVGAMPTVLAFELAFAALAAADGSVAPIPTAEGEHPNILRALLDVAFGDRLVCCGAGARGAATLVTVEV